MKRILLWALIFSLSAHFSRADVPREGEPGLMTDAELDLLLGPIALYPDPLLAVALPAATEPGEIVMAARYLDGGGHLDFVDAQPWSDSVKALARYPDVLRWMDENLEWTTQLGHAFLAQPQDVMDTIQRLRELAQMLGNLRSTPEQIVVIEDGDIDILPVDPEAIFVPIYEPLVVFTRAAAFGAPPYISFRSRAPAGMWLKHDWDWPNRRLIIWTKENGRPKTWWSQTRQKRCEGVTQLKDWRPRTRGGQLPVGWRTDRPQSRGETPRIENRPRVNPGTAPNQTTSARSGGRTASPARSPALSGR